MISQVKLLLQLADTLVEKGHAHAPNIKQWVEEVKNRTTTQDLKFVFRHHNDSSSKFPSQGGRYLQELFNPYGQVPGKGIA